MTNERFNRHATAVLSSLVVLITAIGCAGEGNDNSKPSVTDATMASATATVRPSLAPPVSTPPNTAIVAVGVVGEEFGLNSAGAPPWLYNVGVTETLFLRNPVTDATEPWLGESWTVSDDLSSASITIGNSAEFRYIDDSGQVKRLGTVTAEDVVISFNDASARTNTDSRHTLAGPYEFFFDEWKTVDERTLEFDFSLHVPFWNSEFLSDSGNAISIFPSTADPRLAEGTVIGTGPYLVEKWLENEELTVLSSSAAGAGDHWKFRPKTERVTFWEIPEPGTRLALMINGEVDVAEIEVEDVIQFLGSDYVIRPVGGWQLGIFFAGNLWEEVSAIDGELLSRTTYQEDLPWIGNPDDSKDMEEARSVRNALARAYDRDEINESVLGGVGSRLDVTYFDSYHGRFQDSWRYEFDTELAASVLRGESNKWPNDGTYHKGSVTSDQDDLLNGNSFEISLYAGPTLGGGSGISGILVDRIAGYWADLGLEVKTLKFPYRPDFRPTVVERSNTHPWVSACDEGRRDSIWHSPKGRVQTSLTRGDFGCGFEDPTILDLFKRANAERDESRRSEIVDEYVDHVHHEALQPGIISVPGFFWVMNPNKIKSWDMGKSHSSDGRLGHIGRPWNLELN